MIGAILNQKGGVGKTTVSVNLAFGLALFGKKTLIIDLDPQAHSTVIYCQDIPSLTVRDLLLDRNFKTEKVITQAVVGEKPIDNLFIVPTNIRLAATVEQVISRVHREKLLHYHTSKLKKEFDFIIIDCPPMLGVLTMNAIYASNFNLIPTTYSRYALDGIADLFNTINEVKEGKEYYYYILRNSLDNRTSKTNTFIENQLKDERLTSTIIEKCEAINQAQIQGEPLYTFDSKSRAVENFNSLTQEVISWQKN